MSGFNNKGKFVLGVGIFLVVVLGGVALSSGFTKQSSRVSEGHGVRTATTIKGSTTLDQAVSLAIKEQRKSYLEGEFATEGHLILDSEKKAEAVTVFTIASFGFFGFENGIFTKISGSGAIPTVMIFARNETGDYSLLAYKEPKDGEYYTDSIKKLFPNRLHNQVLSAHKEYPKLAMQQEEQAAEYLKSIGRIAQVSEKHVDKQLPDIDVEASNKLFAELTKYNSFLNNCPYWIGTREIMENDGRYIYETSQSKTNDGYDLIIFKKTKEDGTVMTEYQYKIVGSEPLLIK
ncbi:transcriptional regulator [Desulforamulus aeronauticus]|uniref:Bla regulator protein blaR1 n=1 Tax=Desulforamulus aeronauticus DSM 10349 TaxID=1121421 RepID=A0A1M6PZF5_9FIRM|nr:transcriptional regulator [Desulforamulus aeronauticus]SHK13329.1 bla regulator protein blaR1 [Desulforamulus aeronauticus DSM 10349]